MGQEEKEVQMAKVKKLSIMPVTIEVEYARPILGRMLVTFLRLRWTTLKKINMELNNKIVYSFYALIIPHFVKGGGGGEE